MFALLFLVSCGTKDNPCQAMIDEICQKCDTESCEFYELEYGDAADDDDKAQFCRNYTDETVAACSESADADADADADDDADDGADA